MKTSPICWILASCLLLCCLPPLEAAAPRNGRYKGTITITTVSEGSRVAVKKVFPIIGVLTNGAMEFAMSEVPAGTGYFTGPVFKGTVIDGEVSILPNNNALGLPFGDEKTTASSFKGSVDLGFAQSVGGQFLAFRRFISIAMTRVGN